MTTQHSTPSSEGTTPTRALFVGSAALFTDMLVHGLAVPVLPLLPAVVEQGPAATGLLFSSYAIAMIVATVFSGRLVDRYGPKTPLLIGLVGLAATTLIFAIGGPYWLLLVARLAPDATTSARARGTFLRVVVDQRRREPARSASAAANEYRRYL